MVHGPLVQPGHFFELVRVSSKLDELRQLHSIFSKLSIAVKKNKKNVDVIVPLQILGVVKKHV